MSEQIAAIGVDPGWRWTGCVLRVGDTPVNGFTAGPVGEDGTFSLRANDGMDLPALHRYKRRIGEQLDKLFDQAVELGHERPLVAVEMPSAPRGKGRRDFLIAYRAFRVTELVAWGVVWRYDAEYTMAPGNNGTWHYKSRGGTGDVAHYYPEALRRRRPMGWLPNDEPDNARSHERAAWDVAGRAIEAHLSKAGAA